ncbi:cell shape determining protein MreB [Spiroplasma clarkii]|uniref:Cell shape determining protein MreB n=1 Tax=Spiroplasma clarkii TaxID=2139 RepID=A0A1Y0KZG4_9MOLU|nr:rod shape-determining protein [Spiroplasma clarkii]ARU90885.1 cell shape determining protein MreB [Spiroplasma clarkii]ATX71675.1 cell shape determining protein MreB [Spiroplasma clarkii]
MAKNAAKQKTHVAIDIGTSKTRIYIEKLGMVFDEATIMAMDYKTKKVVAVGDAAKKFVGKLSKNILIKYPLKRGVISDMSILRLFLAHILQKNKNDIKDSIVTLACPISVTSFERDSLITTIKGLGVYYVDVQDDIKLAVLGAGFNIHKSDAYLCLDIGAGKSTVGIISFNETVISKWSKIAGNSIDLEIIKYLKAKKQMAVGEISAEALKNAVGSLIKNKNPLKTAVYGYNMNSGLPTNTEINEDDISKIIVSAFNNLTALITSALEEAPNEVAGDVIKNGLIITGGVAQIPGVKFYFEDYFEIPVTVAKGASNAVINGAIAYKSDSFAYAGSI